MQAIIVKYYPPTSRRGGYSIASSAGGKMRFSYGSTSDFINPTRYCAETLRDSLNWKGDLLQGTLPNGDDVFVFDDPLSRR